MTICVAALYENGHGAVLVSDRMVTAHFPIGYEFEHDETTKMIKMREALDVYSLLAGDVLLGTEIINAAREHIELQEISSATMIAEMVRVAYQQKRLARVVKSELEPRGLSLQEYYNNQQRLLPQIVQVMDQALRQTDIGVEIIVAGPSGSQCSVHTIMNPGVDSDNSSIGYSAIGSGAPHAIYSLIEALYKPYSLIEALYKPSLSKEKVKEIVESAKKRSEVAPGVGSRTQFRIISLQGGDNGISDQTT